MIIETAYLVEIHNTIKDNATGNNKFIRFVLFDHWMIKNDGEPKIVVDSR